MKDFEHHDGVIGFATDLSGMERGQDFFERFPIDEFIDAREDIIREILVDEVFANSELSLVFLEHRTNSLSFGLFEHENSDFFRKFFKSLLP